MPLELASLHALRRSAWWIQVHAVVDCPPFSANNACVVKASISLFAIILGLSEMKRDEFEYSFNPRLAKDRARELS